MSAGRSLFDYLNEERQRDTHDAKVSRAVGTRPARESIAARFSRFNRQNPQVFDRLAALALAEVAAYDAFAVPHEKRRLSIALLFEVLRHEGIVTTGRHDLYELNNDYRRPYAELLEEHYPQFRGLFEHRAVKAA